MDTRMTVQPLFLPVLVQQHRASGYKRDQSRASSRSEDQFKDASGYTGEEGQLGIG